MFCLINRAITKALITLEKLKFSYAENLDFTESHTYRYNFYIIHASSGCLYQWASFHLEAEPILSFLRAIALT